MIFLYTSLYIFLSFMACLEFWKKKENENFEESGEFFLVIFFSVSSQRNEKKNI